MTALGAKLFYCFTFRRAFVGWWLLAGWLAVGAGRPAQAQQLAPDTLVPVSEALVRHTLERSLSVQSLNEAGVTAVQRYALIHWAGVAGIRLAGRVGGWWLSPNTDGDAQTHLDTLRRNIALLRAAQPGVVAQGCVFEIVYPWVDGLTVPNWMRAEFGEDTLEQPRRHFRFQAMMYPEYYAATNKAGYRWDARPPGQAPGTPDISRLETQLWYYYCATRQIAAGCEAIHFGQIRLIDDRDPGHHAAWSVLSRIRRYARTHNRGFVLCDAHSHGEYYDPLPNAPLPDSVRQLLFDFHSSPLRPVECDTLRQGTHAASLTVLTQYGDGGPIYQQSRGGRAPGGWLCRHLPAQAEFDNGPTGVPGQPGVWYLVWGRDEVSWYANQPPDYRSRWLIYAQARIRQLDPDTYFQMVGARGVSLTTYPQSKYWATEAGQAATIQAIWAGQTAAEGARLVLTGPPAP